MNIEEKICMPWALADYIKNLPRPLVMTNGVFDVLHKGHVSYLHSAAMQGASMLVAVNTDYSVRMLGKGPDRPLNNAHDRAWVLAGLSSVDLVTFFDTRTPVELIRSIRPDVYVKGGDYDMETLEETEVLRSWGGKSLSIPFVEGFSTTALVQRIQAPDKALRKAAFLDRDGVINKDKFYVHSWEDFEFLPGAIAGMRRLQEAGYVLVIVTNQSGLARGYYTEAQYQALNLDLKSKLDRERVWIEGIYHCPHHPDGIVAELSVKCDCRKPGPGLLLRAARDLGLCLSESILVGDKATDIGAARAAGVGRAYLVNSDSSGDEATNPQPDDQFASLLDCASVLYPNPHGMS